MLEQNFNAGWKISDPDKLIKIMEGKEYTLDLPVHLPHDYMILSERSEDVPFGVASGYYKTSDMVYNKEFEVPAEWAGKKVWVEFEGVYSNSFIMVNGNYVGKHPFGYGNFLIDLTRYIEHGKINKLKVIVKNGMGLNSRWYSGAGIYRNVKLYVTNYSYIQLDGVKISTPSIDSDMSEVLVNTEIVCEDQGYNEFHVLTEIFDANGEKIAQDKAPVTIGASQMIKVRQCMFVRNPKLWSLEEPNLYYCDVRLMSGDRIIDEAKNHFGIREIQFDKKYGFRLNGKTVKLRGACIHHDNGVIGACAFSRAEERKVELLKKAGFNALRSAHNPSSRVLLDACDRIGMLVVDESFDVWNVAKTKYDYSMFFEEWWEKDVKAMVDKDFNHPSVVMYSIGNEIPERDGSSNGAMMARKQAELVRAIDPTRFVASAICDLLGPRGYSFEDMVEDISKLMVQKDKKDKGETASSGVNPTKINPYFELTDEYASVLDIVGYNYLHNRWEFDLERCPNRIICGTESQAAQIADIWRLVCKHPSIIGDFCWTGMDYIGEVGCGKIDYSGLKTMFGKWPWILAYCGDIDLIGTRRPQSYYREIVWGLRKDPYIAVSRPERYGQTPSVTAWSWSDVVESWSFPGFEGTPVKVEVYADADEVELLRNGISLGKMVAGDRVNFKAFFETTYEPGELLAIAYKNGVESGHMVIKTVGNPAAIKMIPDRMTIEAGAEDLCYITIIFVDEEDNFVPYMNKKVKVTVRGAGSLQGSGSGNPTTDENFYDDTTTTFDGRMLAVVRSGEKAGKIEVTAESEGFEPATIELTCR